MKNFLIISLTVALATSASPARGGEASVKSFRIVRPVDTASQQAELDLPTFSLSGSGDVLAKVYVVTLGEQDPTKAKGWVVRDGANLTLCFNLPYYPMPPLEDGSAYAPVAYVSRLEYTIAGLPDLPTHAIVTEKCPVGHSQFIQAEPVLWHGLIGRQMAWRVRSERE